jgi:hypothetical protein
VVEAKRSDVAERVEPEVAQPLRDQEQHDGPADEKADRVQHAVEAGAVDERSDAQEGRGGQEVAGDREAVLQRLDAAAGGVEVGRRLRLVRRAPGDHEARRDEREEHHDRDRAVARRVRIRGRGVGREGEAGSRGERAGDEGAKAGGHSPISSTSSSFMRPNSVPARCT